MEQPQTPPARPVTKGVGKVKLIVGVVVAIVVIGVIAGVAVFKGVTPTSPWGTTDTDGDGLPDAWETSHGTNPNNPNDVNQDPDNDNYTNLQEYQGGSNPNDNTSTPTTGGTQLYSTDPADVVLRLSDMPSGGSVENEGGAGEGGYYEGHYISAEYTRYFHLGNSSITSRALRFPSIEGANEFRDYTLQLNPEAQTLPTPIGDEAYYTLSVTQFNLFFRKSNFIATVEWNASLPSMSEAASYLQIMANRIT